MPQVIRVPVHMLIFNINKDSDMSLTTPRSHTLNMNKLYTDELTSDAVKPGCLGVLNQLQCHQCRY